MNSQNNEEQIILDHFGPDFRGILLDIGANDGTTLSNSYACMMRGWAGVFVEPSPEAFARLRRLHELHSEWWALDINAAITPQDGRYVLHQSGEHLKTGDTALLSSVIEGETKQWERTGHTFEAVEVDGITVATMLDKLKGKGVERFDLVSIDAEGMDYDILKELDLTALGVQMVIVEHNGSNHLGMHSHAAAHGMKLHAKNFQNLVFTR